MPRWERADPAELGLDRARLEQARDYALTGGGSGYIIRGGKLVLAWGDPTRRYDLKSSTKSIGVTALGLAIQDGKLAARRPGTPSTIPGLGVPPEEQRPHRLARPDHDPPPGDADGRFRQAGRLRPLLFRARHAMALQRRRPELAGRVPHARLRPRPGRAACSSGSSRRWASPATDLVWRRNSYRPQTLDGVERREFGSGISANVDAMARIGLLYLRGGRWQDARSCPRDFVDAARTTVPGVVGLPVHDDAEDYGNASDHYGLLWWNNADGTIASVPRDAYWSWGLYDSLIVVIPSLDLVVARAGPVLEAERGRGPLRRARAVPRGRSSPPCGPAAVGARRARTRPAPSILGIDWAPASHDRPPGRGQRQLADDLGRRRRPLHRLRRRPRLRAVRARQKLSLGLARVAGPPEDFRGVNLRVADRRAARRRPGRARRPAAC